MNRTTGGSTKAEAAGAGSSAAAGLAQGASVGSSAGGLATGGARPVLGPSSISGERGLDEVRVPEAVRACLATKPGEYDARRLRSQRDIIRDVMLSAADCETWLTLGELRALTRYGEASISAQLRHLRKAENGGYEVTKRQREGASPERPGGDGRGECVWEYRISRAAGGERAEIAAEELVTAGG